MSNMDGSVNTQSPKEKSMRVSTLAAAVSSALAVSASSAWAVQTLEDFRFPESGAYPAYPAASAETGRNFHLFTYGGLYRDNNLFRLPASADRQADSWRRLGVGLRGEIPVSRQLFILDAQIDNNKFNKFSILDNTGYRLRGTWNWALGNSLQGDLGASRERAMAGFGQVQAITSNEATQDRVFGSANYMVSPSVRLRAAGNRVSFKTTDAARALFDNEQTDAIVGADYVSGLQNSIGLQIRRSHGAFPNQQVTTPTGPVTINSQYKETEPSVTVHYNIGGKSSLDGRLGYTKRTHDQLPSRDYRGSTGNLVFHWSPTPKTLIDTTLFRETRPFVTSAIGAILTSVDSTAAYVVARGIRFEPRWAVTDQVTLQLQLLDERDSFKGDPTTAALSASDREDRFRAGVIGAGWSPLRPLLLTLSVERGERKSNIAGRDFKYDAVSLNARYTFF
jgi:exopolysaccharide biosynthesis operon protein EpsL